jgi:peptidoglycan hydrolase-like protein with peptidoglycan-binding domain
MDKKKKALIVSALLIGVGGFYIYNNMKKNKAVAVPETPETPETTIDTQKVLSVGSTGEEVKRLQTALKGGLVADGIFGALTEKRLKAITGQTSISLREYNNFMASKNKK